MAFNDGAANTAAQQPASGSLATGDAPIVSNQSSAKEQLRAELAKDGLESLADWYWEQLLAGKSEAEIELAIYDRPEVAARYPGMKARRDQGQAISFDTYRAMERGYAQLMREYGLPEGFYDSPDDFAKWIEQDRSVNEQRALLDDYKTFLYQTSPVARDEAFRLWGLTEGDLLANIIDGSKAAPLIHAQVLGAQAAGASRMSGYGALTVNEAEQLGRLDLNASQLGEGFDFLGRATELFQGNIGEADQSALTRQEQLDSTFSGNTAARRRIEKRARERVAQFSGGGGYATTQQGVTGLGSADA